MIQAIGKRINQNAKKPSDKGFFKKFYAPYTALELPVRLLADSQRHFHSDSVGILAI